MKRPSVSLIIAMLALFISLGGAATAATHYLITSTKQISPKVLKKLEKAGPRGAPGAAGTAGASGIASIRYVTATVGSGVNTATANCPDGYVAVGGAAGVGGANWPVSASMSQTSTYYNSEPGLTLTVTAVCATGPGITAQAAVARADRLADTTAASARDRALARAATAKKSVLVSRRGEKAGTYVAKPSKLDLIDGYLSAVEAAHLKWVDWGQPVAFATGDILIQTSAKSFESVRGALVLTGRIACGTKPTSYYTSATVYTPTYPKYSTIGTGKPGLASPC